MDKVIKDGYVAVLFSPGYGAGWSTWAYDVDRKELVFDPGLVALIEKGEHEEAVQYCRQKWPNAYLGGVEDLEIEWLPVGTPFRIEEYDGSERVETYDPGDYMVA